LQELCFEKRNATNPVCVKRRQKYLEAVNNCVLCECVSISKVDGKTPSEIIRSLTTQNIDLEGRSETKKAREQTLSLPYTENQV
jgi:hypothetical protein